MPADPYNPFNAFEDSRGSFRSPAPQWSGPPMPQFPLSPNDLLNEGFSSATQNSFGPLGSFYNFLSGKGALNVGDDTGSLSLSPGGSFNLQSKKGWSVRGNPANQSLGVDIPVGRGGGRGTVGLEGSFSQQDPYIKANFAFGGNAAQQTSNPTDEINKALLPYGNSVSPTTPEQTPREFLNNMLNKYQADNPYWYRDRP